MKQIILTFLLLTAFLFLSGMGSLSKRPAHKMIDHRYFKCVKSRNLEGGIYGKGPFKKFGPEKSSCWRHQWEEINISEFKKLATEWYGYDWSNEIPFWNRALKE